MVVALDLNRFSNSSGVSLRPSKSSAMFWATATIPATKGVAWLVPPCESTPPPGAAPVIKAPCANITSTSVLLWLKEVTRSDAVRKSFAPAAQKKRPTLSCHTAPTGITLGSFAGALTPGLGPVS